ncbi:hypothetical protein AM500_11985 [Bacillus sp. FJAT-18017]|uniref:DUF2164 domain-containing protein n=1 Tax=Bacillus sp. FJAT-18017 TaxID=1705566 RepID=UPI0006AEC06A|nr:DUF2164 domain-containing protein [Bacillus sp. FJAT-18017]ALC90425.1 hypothetical protein AM500_11985 [Bacillus sp. FJAT-18017]
MLVKFSKDQKDQLIYEIQRFFTKEREEEIGNLEAEQLLEFFKEKLGPHYFNEGVNQSRKTAMERMLQLEEDLYSLERPVK